MNNSVEFFLKEIEERVKKMYEKTKEETIEPLLQDECLEIITFISYLKKLNRYKTISESRLEKNIEKAFYQIMHKKSLGELKMIYGYEDLDMTFEMFLKTLEKEKFKKIEIKLLLKILV